MKERKCNEEYRPSSAKQEKLRRVSKTQQPTFLWKHKIDVLTHHDQPTCQNVPPFFGYPIVSRCLCSHYFLEPTTECQEGSCRHWRRVCLWQNYPKCWIVSGCSWLFNDLVWAVQSNCTKVWRTKWEIHWCCFSKGTITEIAKRFLSGCAWFTWMPSLFLTPFSCIGFFL